MAKYITLVHLKSAIQAVAAYINAQIKSHTHTRQQITDFPTSMPASDVSSWAKQSTKPSYTKSEVGLGNVPNVATNDQTPTFTTASTRANIATNEKLSVLFGKIAKWYTDLKTVAWTGKYSDLSDAPTSLPASDVPSWAKQSSKPAYTAGEVGAAPSSHTSVSVASSDGAHNLRYYNGKLQYKDGSTWKTLSIADLLI